MKHLPTILLTGMLALSLRAQTPPPAGDPFVKNAGAAADVGDDGPWHNCLVIFEVYALDRDDAASVLDAEPGDGARYRRVLDLAKAGKARLEILSGVSTKSGQRAVCEAIDDVRYPTEFAPPASAKGLAAPTAWESRNVGDTLEVEPVIGADGLSCEVNLAPQRVTLLGLRDTTGMAGDAAISQPLFDTQKLTTATTVKDREPHFLGTLTPPPALPGPANGEGKPETWLAFLHVTLQGPADTAKKPGGQAASQSPVRLEYSYYSLDRTLAREILVAPESINAPWEKLQALLGKKEARLEHIISVTTKPGQRASGEEIHEVRFMSEYASESRMSSLETTQHYAPKSATDKTMVLTENVVVNRTEANAERLPGHATAFETRSAGVTVEVEPVLLPDVWSIDLNQVVQDVQYLGDLKTTGVATRYPAVPLFQSAKVTTGLIIPQDQRVFVSTFNRPGANGVNDRADTGRTWLLFVRATVGQP